MALSFYSRLHWFFRAQPAPRKFAYRLLENDLMRPLNAWRIRQVITRYKNFPRVVALESSSLCNSRCSICAHQFLTRTAGIMSFDLFKAAADECARHPATKLYLSGFGEPFLDPALGEKIDYAKGKGLWVGLVTNGSLIDDQIARELVRAGLDELNISIDGFSPAVYNQIRRGLDFIRVSANIERLVQLRSGNQPVINLEVVVFEKNLDDVKLGYQHWRRIVDHVILRRPQDWLATITASTLGASLCPRARIRPPCHYPFTELTIYHQGTAPLCCLDYDALVKIGTFPQRSIQEIWTGEPLSAIRALHLRAEQQKISACRRCSYFSVWW